MQKVVVTKWKASMMATVSASTALYEVKRLVVGLDVSDYVGAYGILTASEGQQKAGKAAIGEAERRKIQKALLDEMTDLADGSLPGSDD